MSVHSHPADRENRPPGASLEDLTWKEAEALFARDPVVVVPLGAISKEHGAHLPLNTDFVVARALAEALMGSLPILVAPVVGFGYYPAFRHYAGSQHLNPDTFAALMTQILEGYIDQGVKRLAIINTGVSTEAPLRIVVREIFERRRLRVAVADISRFGRSGTVGLEQKIGGHADEHETSIMLAISPESVRLDRAVTDYGNQLTVPETAFYQPAIFDPDPESGLDYSKAGARGDPTRATAEKGQRAFAAMVDELTRGLISLFPDLAANH